MTDAALSLLWRVSRFISVLQMENDANERIAREIDTIPDPLKGGVPNAATSSDEN